MKQALVICVFIFCTQPLSAQKYTEYLSSAKSHLESGNIDKAVSCYNVYKSMTGKVNDEFEEELNTEIANNWGGIQKAEGEEYDFVGNKPLFEEQLQAVRLRGKYGFIDITGKVVIPIKFDNIEGGAPDRGYANVWTGDDLMSICINKKWGYINKEGKVVIPPIYDKVDPTVKDGYSFARVWKDGLVGGIDYNGEFLLPMQYQEIEERVYYVDLPFYAKKDNKYGFLNSDYSLLIPFKYDYVSKYWYSDERLCKVGINGKYGYIDVSGNEIIPLTYDSADSFSYGLAAVSRNGNYGYIDVSGSEIIPLIYDSAGSFSDGLAAVSRNGKYGYIDMSGNEIVPLIYDSAASFRNGLAAVTEDGKMGFINKVGTVIIPLMEGIEESWDSWMFGSSQYIAFVKSVTNQKYGIINRKGELIVDYKYDGIRSWSSSGKFTCAIGKDLVYIDAAGNEYQTEKEMDKKSDEIMAKQGYVRYVDWDFLRRENKELAYELLLKVVERGGIDAVRALRIIADGYEKRGEYKLAYDWYLKAVESGDIESLGSIGDLFFYKKGLEVSYSKAVEWYLKYLESSDYLEYNNNSLCFYHLGYMYYYGGYGIPSSYLKALEYFQKSTMNEAKYYLGWMYEHGQGVDVDNVKAIKYYKASRGERDAEERIVKLSN